MAPGLERRRERKRKKDKTKPNYSSKVHTLAEEEKQRRGDPKVFMYAPLTGCAEGWLTDRHIGTARTTQRRESSLLPGAIDCLCSTHATFAGSKESAWWAAVYRKFASASLRYQIGCRRRLVEPSFPALNLANPAAR
jgi:hypothetical protein